MPELPASPPVTAEWIQNSLAYTAAIGSDELKDASEPFIMAGFSASQAAGCVLAKAYVEAVHEKEEALAQAEMDIEELIANQPHVPALVRLLIFLVICSAFCILGYALGRAHS
jgi:hypothetical protein